MPYVPFKIEIDKKKYVIGDSLEVFQKTISSYMANLKKSKPALQEVEKKAKEIEKLARNAYENVSGIENSEGRISDIWEKSFKGLYFEFQKVLQINNEDVKKKQLQDCIRDLEKYNQQVEFKTAELEKAILLHEKNLKSLQRMLDEMSKEIG